MAGVCTTVPSVCSDQEGGEEMDSREQNRTAQLWLSALLILQREDSLGAMVSHSLEEWPVSVTRSWGS